jgi:hypothetical protein
MGRTAGLEVMLKADPGAGAFGQSPTRPETLNQLWAVGVEQKPFNSAFFPFFVPFGVSRQVIQ